MPVLQCDEHIERPLWRALGARGVVAYRVEDENLKGMRDIDLLAYCRKTERILLTADTDCLLLAKKEEHPGIIFITNQQAPMPEIVRSILFWLQTLAGEELKNSLFYIPFKP